MITQSATIWAGSVNVWLADVTQPLLSVIVTLYEPEERKPISSVFSPFDHSNTNGSVPPPIVKSIEPSSNPKQLGSLNVIVGVVKGVGEETLILTVFWQLLSSNTVTS